MRLAHTFANALLALVFFASLAQAETKTVTWEDLVPSAGSGIPISLKGAGTPIGTPGIAEFDGNKEDWEAFKEDISFMKQLQPEGGLLNLGLHNRIVKIAGYVTPVGFDGQDVTELLFVPYMGACIHVPPPAANQIIYVKNAKGMTADQMWEPFWLVGTLKASPVSTILADVGYSIDGAKLEPYTDGDMDNGFVYNENETYFIDETGKPDDSNADPNTDTN
ncbi:MAG: DUF3299 domain-containing protein, partial [Pseudomonadota bacterium]